MGMRRLGQHIVDTTFSCLPPKVACHPERSEGSIFSVFCFLFFHATLRKRKGKKHGFPVATGNDERERVYRAWFLRSRWRFRLRERQKSAKMDPSLRLRMTRGRGRGQGRAVSTSCWPTKNDGQPGHCKALTRVWLRRGCGDGLGDGAAAVGCDRQDCGGWGSMGRDGSDSISWTLHLLACACRPLSS